jgi:hypothetical protein
LTIEPAGPQIEIKFISREIKFQFQKSHFSLQQCFSPEDWAGNGRPSLVTEPGAPREEAVGPNPLAFACQSDDGLT